MAIVVIEVDEVKPFIGAALYALDLATKAKEANDTRAMEIELENARRELLALSEKLEVKP